MLRKCTKNEYEKYVDFIYELALDQSKSGYPTYCDGIKTKEYFIERSLKAFTRDTEEILLFEYEGKVEGWIHYYFLPEDNYLSTVSFNIDEHTKEALKEFLKFAEDNFKGYDLFLGYSKDNKKAIEFLSSNGFNCIEDDYNNTAYLDKYSPIKTNDNIVRITKENYELFRKLHCQIEGDMYWNSDRIYDDIDNWIIFVKLNNNEVVGNVYYMTADDGWFEIFGIDLINNVFNKDVFYDLLANALNTAKEMDGKFMTFFCDEEGEETVLNLGFKCVGAYVCFKKELI